MAIRALIFDFDGLILDTEYPEYQAWQAVFDQYHVHLPLAEWVKCVGSSFEQFNPVDYLCTQINTTLDPGPLRSQQAAYHARIIQQELPLPGVSDMLEAASKAGLKLAVASSSSRKWVEGHLTRLGLIHYFDVLCTNEMVEKVKPSPALFLCALRELNISAHEAIIFEDSLNGLIAAKAADIYCVVVPNRVTRGLDFKNADLVVPSLQDLPLTRLLAQANNHHL